MPGNQVLGVAPGNCGDRKIAFAELGEDMVLPRSPRTRATGDRIISARNGATVAANFRQKISALARAPACEVRVFRLPGRPSDQNTMRRPNWITRPSVASLMIPKPGPPSALPGNPKSAWLKALNVSQRN
jgi:hypothetical protein